MKYHPLWQLLSNYRVEHTLISLIGTCHCICSRRFARPIQQHCWLCKFWVVGQKPDFILTGIFVYVFLDKNRISQHKTQPLLHLTHIGRWGISPTDKLLVTDASEMLHTSSLMDGVGVQTLTSRMGAWNSWFIEHSRIAIFLYVRCSFSLVTFVYTCCVNIHLIFILNPTYVELLQTKISTDSYICVGVKNGFQN